MKPKNTRTPRASNVSKKQPSKDAVTASQQANQFPAIGMTLTSYKDSDTLNKKDFTPPPKYKPTRFQKIKNGITKKRIFVAFLGLLIVLFIWFGGRMLYNAQRIFGGSIFSFFSNTKLKGEDSGRVNILLAGNSSDDLGHQGGQLTDSIMILSIDTRNNKAFMLSVPRDLYVDIGRSGYGKINSAYVVGEQNKFSYPGYAKGGMGQLEQIIENKFGLKMHYFALVNYNALKEAVDSVGGIDVVINSKDPRGLYDPNIDWTNRKPLVKLTNGPHRLNGQQALNLARARGDAYNSYGFAGSDFDRTSNQRMMLLALKNKATSSSVLANPAKLADLSDAIGKNVSTDLKASQLKRLYTLTKKIDSGNVKSLSLNEANGKQLLKSYTAPGGQSTLIPALGLNDYTDIQSFILQQTSNNPIIQENASVVVLNGTDYDGLGSSQKTELSKKRIRVIKVGDAGKNYSTSQVIDLSKGKFSATRAALGNSYGNKFTTIDPYNGAYDTDFIVIVGTEKIPKTSN